MLHRVAKPCGQIALSVSPSYRPWHRNLGRWLCAVAGVANGHEIIIFVLTPLVDEALEEFENASVLPDVFAEGFEVHEEVDKWSAQSVSLDPLHVFVDRERPFLPMFV